VVEARVNECTIWNNSLVRISKYRLFFYKHWAKAGVQNMKDLVDNNFKVMYTDFRGKYFLCASFFEFYGVPSAIRSAIKSLKLRMQDWKDQGFSVQKLIAVTNSFLSKIEILETALCYLWKTDKETLIRLFWEWKRKPFRDGFIVFSLIFHSFDTSLTNFGYLWMFRIKRRQIWYFK